MLKEYKSGYVTVTNGSAVVQGVGTSWMTYAQVGQAIFIDSVEYFINDITSINSLVIDRAYEGVSAENITYKILADTSFNVTAAKILKLAEIDSAYLESNKSSFSYDGKQYSATDNAKFSLMAINGYIATNGDLPPNFPNVWAALDGTVISILTVAQFKELYAAMVAQGSENFIRLAYLQAQINALPSTATQADFDAIVW